MKKITYHKLIRDKIPEIIEKDGKIAVTSILSDEEYMEALDKKLMEEIKEYQESKDIEELADILEVIYAIAKAKNRSICELEDIRRNKADKRGSFDRKVFLKEVIEN